MDEDSEGRRDAQRLVAIQAYEHAAAAQNDRHAHRLDLADTSLRARRRLFIRPPPPVGIESAASETWMRAFKSPTETAFKLGFGFTAGAWSFRGILLLAAGSLMLLGIIQLLNAVVG